MRETSVRELLHEAMAGHEPAVSQELLGGAIRAARRTRRLRWMAAVSASAAAVPALAFGVPALAGALGHAAIGQRASSPATHRSQGTHGRPAPRHTTAGRNKLLFLRPTLPTASTEPNPVPITDQSIGQLLIDDMPAGARRSQIEANVNFNPANAYRTAYAVFNVVRTPIGAGNVEAVMMVAGPSPFGIGCHGRSAATCRTYRLPGGVRVEEEYMGGLSVSVFRPNVAEMSVSESNVAMAAGSRPSKGMPLTLAQLIKVALDPRWQFTMSQSFVQNASGLKVAVFTGAGS